MILAIGIIIGLILGLTGAGGSAFAVPLLILVAGLPVTDSIGIALGAVAASAATGTFYHWQRGGIQWIPALILGTVGLLVSPLGRVLGEQVPPTLLLMGFNVLVVIISVRMWSQAQSSPESMSVVRAAGVDPNNFIKPICRQSSSGQFEWKARCVSALVLGGLVVGLLTGIFGVGGGFFIVPLVLYLTRASMQQAVGTSLIIIAVVSASGFISFATTSKAMDWPLIATISGGGFIGMLLGHLISAKVTGPELQKFFAVALVLVALLTLSPQLFS